MHRDPFLLVSSFLPKKERTDAWIALSEFYPSVLENPKHRKIIFLHICEKGGYLKFLKKIIASFVVPARLASMGFYRACKGHNLDMAKYLHRRFNIKKISAFKFTAISSTRNIPLSSDSHRRDKMVLYIIENFFVKDQVFAVFLKDTLEKRGRLSPLFPTLFDRNPEISEPLHGLIVDYFVDCIFTLKGRVLSWCVEKIKASPSHYTRCIMHMIWDCHHAWKNLFPCILRLLEIPEDIIFEKRDDWKNEPWFVYGLLLIRGKMNYSTKLFSPEDMANCLSGYDHIYSVEASPGLNIFMMMQDVGIPDVVERVSPILLKNQKKNQFRVSSEEEIHWALVDIGLDMESLFSRNLGGDWDKTDVYDDL